VKRFSAEQDRHHVFDPLGDKDRQKKIQEGNWINLYQLQEVAPTATSFEIDEAIIERGADAVFFAFSGNGKPPHILQLEEFLPDMRPILLDAVVRKRYNEQLAMHENADSNAQTYADFVKSLDRREYSGCMAALLPLAILCGAGVLRFLTA